MTIIDNAVYVDGRRTTDPEGLEETYFLLRQREGMAWIGLYRPDRTNCVPWLTSSTSATWQWKTH